MFRSLFTALSVFALCVAALIVTIQVGQAQRGEFAFSQTSPNDGQQAVITTVDSTSLPTDCAIQPDPSPTRNSSRTRRSDRSDWLTLERFRRIETGNANEQNGLPTSSGYTPQELIVLIDPSNYGDRFLRDINGQPADQSPIVVLHETVATASSTIGFFQTPHSQDAAQASYHTLIRQDGTVIYLVPPDKRAFGAGNSVFNSLRGAETVRTHPTFPPSVNNFAYHISLETPADGIDNAAGHSGYTEAQYQALAWLVAKTGVPDDRITTHRAVDRSGTRIDPRSFQFSRFFQLLQTYPKTSDIGIRCTVPRELGAGLS